MVFLHKSQLHLQLAGEPSVVTVAKSDILSLSPFDRIVPCHTRPTVLLQENDLHTIILLLVFHQEVDSVGIRRAIVSD